jgi:excisionase family DNA binding protein
MATFISPTLTLTDAKNRDIFDLLESCEKLLTAREVARILSISEKTVYSYVSRNLIPHYKIEANVRFRARDIANWLRHHTSLIEGQRAVASKRAALNT